MADLITPASPRPWKLDGLTLYNPGQQVIIRAANGDLVALVCRDLPFAVRDANAALIVHACNLYPELFAALKAVHDEKFFGFTDTREKVAALIAKAEGVSHV
jgi:hypothetical protein